MVFSIYMLVPDGDSHLLDYLKGLGPRGLVDYLEYFGLIIEFGFCGQSSGFVCD